MTEIELISITASLLLVVLVFIAEAYWSDAREYMYKAADIVIPRKERIRAVENYDKSLRMFKRATFTMFLTLITIILPIFFPQFINIAKSLLGTISIILIAFLLLMSGGHYFVNLPTPLELIRSLALDREDDDVNDVGDIKNSPKDKCKSNDQSHNP